MNNIVKKQINPTGIQCYIYITRRKNIINLLFTLGKYTFNKKRTLYTIVPFVFFGFRCFCFYFQGPPAIDLILSFASLSCLFKSSTSLRKCSTVPW